ncbi:MAG: AGE family epimerase/isomerase [Kouleothrix sp.]|nr:AGE family epimerase/isomerase [Kouleothrix sp.]
MSQPGQLSGIDPADRRGLRQRIEAELQGNILPFWIEHAVDADSGGFYGALTNDLRVLNDVPRSAVLCARILWTYAAAYRAYGDPAYLAMAQRARDYLARAFWDERHGGVYWLIDRQGAPVNARKHSYAQAFAIYGLAEHHAATGDAESLRLAQALFELLEAHAHEPAYGGYVEGCGPDWGALADMRLSDKEPNCRKSMNTLLHIMEAYANLLRVWDDRRLRERLRELIEIFLQHVVDPRTFHFRLFFDDAWASLEEGISYGHDIEGSWLLIEAAEALGDAALLARVRATAIEMAAAVYAQALEPDGSLLYESDSGDPRSADKHWWAHAEAMVGFYNAYQLSGRVQFARAAAGCWQYIEQKFVDRRHGEWFKILNRQGVPYADQHKVGPWECPYHHGRACIEMLRRLAA